MPDWTLSTTCWNNRGFTTAFSTHYIKPFDNHNNPRVWEKGALTQPPQLQPLCSACVDKQKEKKTSFHIANARLVSRQAAGDQRDPKGG